MSLGGESVRTLAAGLDRLSDFAVGDRLYFGTIPDLATATLFSCPLAGCGQDNVDAAEVVSRATQGGRPWTLAADAQGLYYAEYLEGAVRALGARPFVTLR
jgi:hypothetical protein